MNLAGVAHIQLTVSDFARSRAFYRAPCEHEDIDSFHVFFKETLAGLGGKLVQAPQEGPWARGYYSILFEDPDGMRLEITTCPARETWPKVSSCR